MAILDGTTTDGFDEVYRLAYSEDTGVVAIGVIKNTGSNTIRAKTKAHNAFTGIETETETNISAGEEWSFSSLSGSVGANSPPYRAFIIELKSQVAGQSSTFSLRSAER
jgi:hypothetical protein